MRATLPPRGAGIRAVRFDLPGTPHRWLLLRETGEVIAYLTDEALRALPARPSVSRPEDVYAGAAAVERMIGRAFGRGSPFRDAPRLVEAAGPLLQHLGPGDVVVDIGCGGGFLVEWLASRGVRAIGVDRARDRLPPRPRRGRYLVADAREIPLPAGCADQVVMTYVLEHVPDIASILTEAARLLRPGGRLLALVPGTTPEERALAREAGPLPLSPGHVRAFAPERLSDTTMTHADLRRVMRNAGLSDVSVRPAGPERRGHRGSWSAQLAVEATRRG